MAMLQAATSVIGGAIGAMGAMQEAQAVAAAENYNAQVATRNQRIVRQETRAALEDASKVNQRTFRMIRASYGGMGLDLAGSPLDVMHDTFIEQRLDKRRIKFAGRIREIELEDQKNLALMHASNVQAAGGISAISSIISGLGGAATALNAV
jgi:hypothetical protein